MLFYAQVPREFKYSGSKAGFSVINMGYNAKVANILERDCLCVFNVLFERTRAVNKNVLQV